MKIPSLYTIGSYRLLLSLLILAISACTQVKTQVFPENKLTNYQLIVNDNRELEKELEKTIKNNRKKSRALKLESNNDFKLSERERNIIRKVSRAEGYYSATIEKNVTPSLIVYEVNAGPRYTIKEFKIKAPSGITTELNKVVQLTQGQALQAKAILEARDRIRSVISRDFCLFEIDVQYKVVVFHESHSALVQFIVEESPEVNIGEIRFHGLNTIKESYIRNQTPLSSGNCFRRSKINQARLQLLQSPLLAQANIEINAPHNGLVDLDIQITERANKTISAGVLYDSDDGFGVALGWTHRNIFGRAERLEIETTLAERRKRLDSSITIPNFRQKKESLAFYTKIENEQNDSFESEVGTFGVEWTRQINKELRGIVAANFDSSTVFEDEEKDSFGLQSFPLTLAYDKRENPLDPQKGYVISVSTQPFWDLYESDSQFTRSTISGSYYFTASTLQYSPTLAMRFASGSLRGGRRSRIPANLRFYVGGGGSVRGYPFQTVGELNEGEPDGGLSFTEVSIESRFKFKKNWGLVAFLDGGYAFADEQAFQTKDMLWGAGLGIRYYSYFAPIRFDFAVPLDQREAIDDSYQVYISIGQAF